MRELLILSLAALAGIAFLGLAGPATGNGTVDTSLLQKAFQSASAVDKAEVQSAISAIQSHDYSGALTHLGKVAQSGNLTPQQKGAVQDTASQVKSSGLGEVQKAIGGGGDLTNQAGQGAGKAAEELNKAFKP